MAREPYTFAQPGAGAQSIFHVVDVGRRLVALAGDRGLQIEVRPTPRADGLKITAVPAAGAPEVIGHVLRPATPELRTRIAMAIALAQSERTAVRLERAA